MTSSAIRYSSSHIVHIQSAPSTHHPSPITHYSLLVTHYSTLVTHQPITQWDFDGYVTSDCGAVQDVATSHDYTNTTFETVNAVLSAGMDSDCGSYMDQSTMETLINNNQDSEEFMGLIDGALTHLFKVQFRLGFFDPRSKVPFSQWGAEVVDTDEHRALSKQAADQSLVLLKNDDAALPLSLPAKPTATIKLAVMGRNANATYNMQGNYYGDAPYLISPLQGLTDFDASIETSYCDGTHTKEAVRLAEKADIAILVVGLTSEAVSPSDEAEGNDRDSLILPYDQDALIEAVSNAVDKVILVVMGGGPVDVAQWRDSDKVQAIMWCGYPGQDGGTALADAIFGATNPGGKLTQTWYPEEYTSQVALDDYRMRPNATEGYPGRSYRFYTGEPVFAFGDGMSYTTFDTTVESQPATFEHVLSADALAKDLTTMAQKPLEKAAPVLSVKATVKNTGARAGAEVVLLYVASPNAGTDGAPLKTLAAFERLQLAAGESDEAVFELTAEHLSYVNDQGERATVHGTWKVWASNDGEERAVEVTVA